MAYSMSEKLRLGEALRPGRFSSEWTDESGNFNIAVITPGVAVFWILPGDLAGELHEVPDGKRGDLGTFTLKPGVSLRGRVVDVFGKPIVGVLVNAERERNDEVNAVLAGFAVADAINRTAVTSADGSFTLAPLPPGRYRVMPGDRPRDGLEHLNARPLHAAFTPLKVALPAGETPEPIEIRASPHVVIEVHWIDAKGNPTQGFSGHVFGRMDGDNWFRDFEVDLSGNSIVQVPHGLENVRLNFSTTAYSAIRWRMARGEPLSNSQTIRLGTLDHDATGIEIIPYDSPIVIVKAETKDNMPVPGLKVSAHYTQTGPEQVGIKRVFAAGQRSDVRFHKQEDGRYQSWQLQPDLEFNLIAEADGFKPVSRMLTIAEGKTEEITLVLEPK